MQKKIKLKREQNEASKICRKLTFSDNGSKFYDPNAQRPDLDDEKYTMLSEGFR